MLATMERVLILEEVEEIVKMILQSELADQYFLCLNHLKNNKQTQEKIRRFVEIKQQYEDVQRFGKYHPDYKEIKKKIREIKREMDLDTHVAEFRRAENDLQSLLDELGMIIGRSISENIKVATGNPFFETHSKSGTGCGTGGGCGCSS